MVFRGRNRTIFGGLPLQSIVDWMAKAGVQKYDKEALQAISKYVTDFTSAQLILRI
jgi:hypothetical protein